MEEINESLKNVAKVLELLKKIYVANEFIAEELGEAILCLENTIDILSQAK